MCNNTFNPRLSSAELVHKQALQELFPEEREYIEDVFSALTANLFPQVNLLVLFTVLKHFFNVSKSTVILDSAPEVLYVPLSIVAKTGDATWTRFRPAAVAELHTAFLSFLMAETNRVALQCALEKHGVWYGQGHCCGILFGTKDGIQSYQKTPLYHNRNRFRSRIETMAMPVETGCLFSSIPKETIDISETEQSFFDAYESVWDHLILPQEASTKGIEKMYRSVLPVIAHQ